MVPVRRAPVFLCTVYLNEPLPGVTFVIQVGALLTAVQVQPRDTVTVTVPVPPAAVKLLLLGEIVQVQVVVAPAVFE